VTGWGDLGALCGFGYWIKDIKTLSKHFEDRWNQREYGSILNFRNNTATRNM
jgi:hypothetical protein